MTWINIFNFSWKWDWVTLSIELLAVRNLSLLFIRDKISNSCYQIWPQRFWFICNCINWSKLGKTLKSFKVRGKVSLRINILRLLDETITALISSRLMLGNLQICLIALIYAELRKILLAKLLILRSINAFLIVILIVIRHFSENICRS